MFQRLWAFAGSIIRPDGTEVTWDNGESNALVPLGGMALTAATVLALSFFSGGLVVGGGGVGVPPTFEEAPSGPEASFVQDWDYADSAAFRNASELGHTCNPTGGTCNAVSGVTTSLTTGLTGTPWSGAKAARTVFAHIDTAIAKGESDARTRVTWVIPGGTNNSHAWFRGWVRHSNTNVGDAVSWQTATPHKTWFVNGNVNVRRAEMKFGPTLVEAKKNNNQRVATAGFPDDGEVAITQSNFAWDGTWYEYCMERGLDTANGIIRLKVDTLLVTSTDTINDSASDTEFSSVEFSINGDPQTHLGFVEWGPLYVYVPADTAGLIAETSVCDFSGNG